MFNSLKNFVTFSSELINAIHINNTERALMLIKQGVNINIGINSNDLTPIYLSVLRDNYKVLFALLENGANPNPTCSYSAESLLKSQIRHSNESTIKLLILHGAKSVEDDMSLATPKLENFIHAKEALYVKIFDLNKAISKESTLKLDIILDELANIWLGEAKTEPHSEFKFYYEKKALHFLGLRQKNKAFLAFIPIENNEVQVNYTDDIEHTTSNTTLIRRRR